MSKINKKTLQHALAVLNVQLDHVYKTDSEKQWAYYKGLHDMLEIIVSDAFTGDAYLYNNANGEHFAQYETGDISAEKVKYSILQAK